MLDAGLREASWLFLLPTVGRRQGAFQRVASLPGQHIRAGVRGYKRLDIEGAQVGAAKFVAPDRPFDRKLGVDLVEAHAQDIIHLTLLAHALQGQCAATAAQPGIKVDITVDAARDGDANLRVAADALPLLRHQRGLQRGDQLVSWLGLCPGTKVSGGRVLSSKTKPTATRAAAILRNAAASLHHSQSALGAYYRRMAARVGKPLAVTATAHKLARIVYSLLKHDTEYSDAGQDYYERQYQERVMRNLQQRAKALGFELVPAVVELAVT
jgi:hypothetical protein